MYAGLQTLVHKIYWLTNTKPGSILESIELRVSILTGPGYSLAQDTYCLDSGWE